MIDRVSLPQPDRVRRILEERARALSRPVASEEPRDVRALVVMVIGRCRFAAPIELIQEVQPVGSLTPVPGAPAYWLGLINLRGRLYPVISLGHYLELPEAQVAKGGKVVVVRSGRVTLGILIDEAPAVREVPLAEIEPPLTAREGGTDMVIGVTQDLLLVLDLQRMLTDPRLALEPVTP
jgi:purine-binding chemotaxis protein CheW